jgi:dihydropyrimidinase
MRRVLLAVILSAIAQDDAPSLVVRNGLVVTHERSREADVRIRDGVIVEIGQKLAAGAGVREIDASGLLVLPGGVDPHVHLGGSGDDYTTGSAAAVAGGVTTISNFVSPQAGENAMAGFERAAALVRAQAVADIMLHWRVNDAEAVTETALRALVERGQPSLKVFMVRPSFDQNALGFLTVLAAAGRAGVMTMMHCEDAAMLAMITERMIAENRGSLAHFSESRPVVIETAATERAVAMSEATGAPVYIVHLSSERALRVAEAAQSRRLPVYVETRPIYLHLTRERYAGRDGASMSGSRRSARGATRTLCGPGSQRERSRSLARITWPTRGSKNWILRRR